MLAVVSSRLTSASAPLVQTDRSLWRQSFARKGQVQRDGWGVAWYAGPRPHVFKSAGPLPEQKELLRRAARKAVGRSVLFHLRRASNPRGLPMARLRGRRNLQPFCFGRWTFAHNGTIPFPDETARRLGTLRRRLRGLNDSEVLFWLIMKELRDRGGAVPAAVRAVRRVLKQVAADFSARPRPPEELNMGRPGRGPKRGTGRQTGTLRRRKAFHAGLNILLTNGRVLWAYSEEPAPHWKGRPGGPPWKTSGEARPPGGLCSPKWPYWRLAFLPTPAGVWVASEPLWSGAAWKAVRSGELLKISEKRAGVVVWKKTRLARAV